MTNAEESEYIKFELECIKLCESIKLNENGPAYWQVIKYNDLAQELEIIEQNENFEFCDKKQRKLSWLLDNFLSTSNIKVVTNNFINRYRQLYSLLNANKQSSWIRFNRMLGACLNKLQDENFDKNLKSMLIFGLVEAIGYERDNPQCLEGAIERLSKFFNINFANTINESLEILRRSIVDSAAVKACEKIYANNPAPGNEVHSNNRFHTLAAPKYGINAQMKESIFHGDFYDEYIYHTLENEFQINYNITDIIKHIKSDIDCNLANLEGFANKYEYLATYLSLYRIELLTENYNKGYIYLADDDSIFEHNNEPKKTRIKFLVISPNNQIQHGNFELPFNISAKQIRDNQDEYIEKILSINELSQHTNCFNGLASNLSNKDFSFNEDFINSCIINHLFNNNYCIFPSDAYKDSLIKICLNIETNRAQLIEDLKKTHKFNEIFNILFDALEIKHSLKQNYKNIINILDEICKTECEEKPVGSDEYPSLVKYLTYKGRIDSLEKTNFQTSYKIFTWFVAGSDDREIVNRFFGSWKTGIKEYCLNNYKFVEFYCKLLSHLFTQKKLTFSNNDNSIFFEHSIEKALIIKEVYKNLSSKNKKRLFSEVFPSLDELLKFKEKDIVFFLTREETHSIFCAANNEDKLSFLSKISYNPLKNILQYYLQKSFETHKEVEIIHVLNLIRQLISKRRTNRLCGKLLQEQEKKQELEILDSILKNIETGQFFIKYNTFNVPLDMWLKVFKLGLGDFDSDKRRKTTYNSYNKFYSNDFEETYTPLEYFFVNFLSITIFKIDNKLEKIELLNIYCELLTQAVKEKQIILSIINYGALIYGLIKILFNAYEKKELTNADFIKIENSYKNILSDIHLNNATNNDLLNLDMNESHVLMSIMRHFKNNKKESQEPLNFYSSEFNEHYPNKAQYIKFYLSICTAWESFEKEIENLSKFNNYKSINTKKEELEIFIFDCLYSNLTNNTNKIDKTLDAQKTTQSLLINNTFETNFSFILIDLALQAIILASIIGAIIKFFYCYNPKKPYFGLFDKIVKSKAVAELENLHNQILSL